MKKDPIKSVFNDDQDVLEVLRDKEGNKKTGVDRMEALNALFKGDDGHTPKKGEDYFTQEEADEWKKEILSGATPKKFEDYFTDSEIEYIIDHVRNGIIEEVTPVKGVHYNDGLPGKNADEVDVEKLKEEVVKEVRVLDEAQDKKDFTGEKIAEKLNTLKGGIESHVIKGFVGVEGVVKAIKEGKLLELRDIKGARLDTPSKPNMNDQRWHGGGDTVAAGTGITITTNTSGVKVISTVGGGGDVVGPAGATDNAIARYDGATGKLIQNSLATISDAGVITATGFNVGTFTPGSVLFAGAGGALTQDNFNLFFDDTNNYLGVGTATPQAKLHVTGITAGTQLLVDYLNTGTNYYDATTAHIWRTTSGFTTRMGLTAAGNLTIGTTTAVDRVTVVGGGVTAQSLNAIGNVAVYAATGGLTLHYTSGVGTIRAYADATGLGTTAIAFVNNGTEWARIGATGLTGIGTTSPFSRLQVRDNIGAYSTNSSSVGSPVGSSLYLGDSNFVSASYFDSAPGLSAVYSTVSSVAGDLAFYVYAGAANARQEAMRFKYATGTTVNVGIGTITPNAKLQITGNSTAALPSTGIYQQLEITGVTEANRLSLGVLTSVVGAAAIGTGVIQALINATAFTNLALNPSGGNVGIGTSAPNSPLEVSVALSGGIPLGLRASRASVPAQFIQLDEGSGAAARVFAQGGNKGLLLVNTNTGAGTGSIMDGFEILVPGATALTTTSALSIMSVSGNVGIGTTSPQTRFVVSNAGTNGFEVDVSSLADNTYLTAYNRNTSIFTDIRVRSATFSILSGGSAQGLYQGSTGLVGIGTTSPTNTLTLPSTSTGYRHFNTSDQTTNTEYLELVWASNVAVLRTGRAGTGNARQLSLTAGNGNPYINLIPANGTVEIGNTNTGAGVIGTNILGINSNNTLYFKILGVSGQISQSGTAGYAGLFISPLESSLGSGEANLIDAGTNTNGTGTGTHTSKFRVTNAGKIGVLTVPTAYLHLPAVTTGSATSPIKFNPGTVMTTPEAGVFEFTNSETGLTFTAVATRRQVVLDTATQTISGKRNQPRTASSTTSANLSPDLSTANVYYRTTQTATLTIDAPTGTPVIGEVITLYVDSVGAQTLTINATYIAFGTAFPATTTAGKTFMLTAQYNGTNWKSTWANAV